ncbi:MAG: DNA gyrase subunit B [Gemmataceae bacterium]|nr:DNA gyrase subunit B [Gemmataceae bacterium]
MASDLVLNEGSVSSASTYDESNIQVLRNRDHIRARPGTYIPDTGVQGLHHLVYELTYNSVDEHLAGYCKNISVTIHPDGSLTVSDDGRGIPVEMHPIEGRPTLEVVMTTVGAGGKFDNNAYKTSAGLNGMGAKAVTALSELTRVEVFRDKKAYRMDFDRGIAATELKELGPTMQTGTHVTFWPDKEIFKDAQFDFETLENRMRELAFLNRGLTIHLKDERENRESKFCFEGGVSEFVQWMNRDSEQVIGPIIHVNKIVPVEKPDGSADQVKVEVALQYRKEAGESVRCYANNQYNPQGGTHLTGFRSAITHTLGHYGEANNFFKDDMKPKGEDFRDGLVAVINVGVSNPQFEAQTKIALNNKEVIGAVSTAVSEKLKKFLEENPKEAKLIMERVRLATEVRKAEEKARQAVVDRKKLLGGAGLPGKLMDCTTRNREESELFLVEGDSAGGSADGGRDRHFQAILPLRGKPLNVEQANSAKMLKNDEISSIMSAVGVDIGNSEDLSKLRYGKIVILTDADVDGQHIRTLLLTFFFRQMRQVIEAGHVYVARPPLYKIKHKKEIKFISTAQELANILYERGLKDTLIRAGERTIEGQQLRELISLLEVIQESLVSLERRGVNLVPFIGKITTEGLPAWHVKVGGKEYWFHTSEEVDAFRVAESKRLGREWVVAASDSQTDDDTRYPAEEYHEIRGLNRALTKLAAFGFTAQDLIPVPRIAGREPPLRYTLESGDSKTPLAHLREVIPNIRRLGERGIEVTRFKGLGEMNAEELWETTLDPKARTLLKVTLNDATKADEMFRKLMGKEVESRREFIIQKGINVKDAIDYGA